MPPCRPELELDIAARPQLQQVVVAAIHETQRIEHLRVTAIEAFGEPQARREHFHGLPQVVRQLAVAGVILLRRRAAVVARHEADHLDLLRVEPAQVPVLDQVIRVPVVLLVADVHADVMQQRRVFEPLALLVGQPVHASCLVEQRQRHLLHLRRVLGPVAASLGELDDAALSDVRDAIGPRDFLAVLMDVVEDQPFAQRQIAQRDLLGLQQLQDRVEQHGAGDDDVGAPRIEAGQPEPLGQRQRRHLLAHPPDLLGRHAQVPQLLGRLAGLVHRGHGSEGEDGARRADHALEFAVGDLLDERLDLAVDVAHELPLVTLGDRIRLHESLGQADDARLEAPRELRALGAAGDLDAASADVDDDGPAPLDVDTVDRRQVNESGFLRAGDHARHGCRSRAGWPAGTPGRSRLHAWRSSPPRESRRRCETARAGEISPAPAAPRPWRCRSGGARRGRRRRGGPFPFRGR